WPHHRRQFRRSRHRSRRRCAVARRPPALRQPPRTGRKRRRTGAAAIAAALHAGLPAGQPGRQDGAGAVGMTPRATYRLQVHRDFPLAAARAQVPYLARLGISHLYLSPILTARAGSMHGYDVVDHSQGSPELGGETALRDLVASLRAHAMGLIVDIVPNHMAVGGADNRLWLDLLEWGRQSRYANFFDIDWDVPDPALKNKVLAPFLGKHYGQALADGELTLQFDTDSGRFAVW